MKIKSLALTVPLLVPAAVFAQITVGDAVGTSEAAIVEALAAQGYTATEFEIENGEIEVEATQNGTLFEFEISPETGLVLAVSLEDDGDDEDDDDDTDSD